MPISRAAYFFIHTIFKKLIFRRLQPLNWIKKQIYPRSGAKPLQQICNHDPIRAARS
jgi:hypothetical protein